MDSFKLKLKTRLCKNFKRNATSSHILFIHIFMYVASMNVISEFGVVQM